MKRRLSGEHPKALESKELVVADDVSARQEKEVAKAAGADLESHNSHEDGVSEFPGLAKQARPRYETRSASSKLAESAATVAAQCADEAAAVETAKSAARPAKLQQVAKDTAAVSAELKASRVAKQPKAHLKTKQSNQDHIEAAAPVRSTHAQQTHAVELPAVAKRTHADEKTKEADGAPAAKTADAKAWIAKQVKAHQEAKASKPNLDVAAMESSGAQESEGAKVSRHDASKVAKAAKRPKASQKLKQAKHENEAVAAVETKQAENIDAMLATRAQLHQELLLNRSSNFSCQPARRPACEEAESETEKEAAASKTHERHIEAEATAAACAAEDVSVADKAKAAEEAAEEANPDEVSAAAAEKVEEELAAAQAEVVEDEAARQIEQERLAAEEAPCKAREQEEAKVAEEAEEETTLLSVTSQVGTWAVTEADQDGETQEEHLPTEEALRKDEDARGAEEAERLPATPQRRRSSSFQGGRSLSPIPPTSPTSIWRSKTAECCSICCDDAPPGEAVRLSCKHGWYCLSCLKRHAEARLDNGFVEVSCPECNQALAERTLRRVLPTSVLEQLERRSLEQAVSAAGDLYACPTANCTFRVALEEGDVARLKCPECKKTSCLRCGAQPYHRGLSCEAYAEKLRSKGKSTGDEELIKWMEETGSKQCPTCRAVVSKQNLEKQNTQYAECHKMQCRNCDTRFCFKCLAVLTPTYSCGCARAEHGFINPKTGRRMNHLKQKAGKK